MSDDFLLQHGGADPAFGRETRHQGFEQLALRKPLLLVNTKLMTFGKQLDVIAVVNVHRREHFEAGARRSKCLKELHAVKNSGPACSKRSARSSTCGGHIALRHHSYRPPRSLGCPAGLRSSIWPSYMPCRFGVIGFSSA
ncbi:MAG: hypothetical protein ACOYNZ_02490 [Rhodoferax sp.]